MGAAGRRCQVWLGRATRASGFAVLTALESVGPV